jgi:hypothetical protein
MRSTVKQMTVLMLCNCHNKHPKRLVTTLRTVGACSALLAAHVVVSSAETTWGVMHRPKSRASRL